MGENDMTILNYQDTPIYYKCHDLFLTAQNYLKENKVKEAYKIYKQIADDKSFPQTYRMDAEYKLASLSGKENPYSSKSNLKPTATKTNYYISKMYN